MTPHEFDQRLTDLVMIGYDMGVMDTLDRPSNDPEQQKTKSERCDLQYQLFTAYKEIYEQVS